MQDGSISVVEEEAETIRRMYEYCTIGYGSRTIANILLKQGYKKNRDHFISYIYRPNDTESAL